MFQGVRPQHPSKWWNHSGSTEDSQEHGNPKKKSCHGKGSRSNISSKRRYSEMKFDNIHVFPYDGRMIYSNDPMARIPTTKPYITSNIKKFKLAIRSFFQKIHHEICANGWHFHTFPPKNSRPPLASPGSSHFDGHQLPRFFTTTFFFPPFPGNTLKLHLFCPKKMHFFFFSSPKWIYQVLCFFWGFQQK